MLKASPSAMAKFRRCRRSWWLTYVEGWSVRPELAPVTGVALMGTRIHTALEAYYGYGIDAVDALNHLYGELIAQRPDRENDLAGERDTAAIMVSGYLDWVAENGIDEDYEVVETERTLDVPIQLTNGEMAIVSGKLDQIVRRKFDGARLVLDYKTVGSLQKADLLILDEQMLVYSALLAIQLPNERVDGALYTMLLRSKQTARATGPFYEQVHIRYNVDQQQSILARIRGVMDDMERTTRQLKAGVDHRVVAYPNPMTDRCNWDCPFKSVCPLFDDGSRVEDAMRANFHRADPYAYRSDATITSIKTAFGVQQEAGK